MNVVHQHQHQLQLLRHLQLPLQLQQLHFHSTHFNFNFHFHFYFIFHFHFHFTSTSTPSTTPSTSSSTSTSTTPSLQFNFNFNNTCWQAPTTIFQINSNIGWFIKLLQISKLKGVNNVEHFNHFKPTIKNGNDKFIISNRKIQSFFNAGSGSGSSMNCSKNVGIPTENFEIGNNHT